MKTKIISAGLAAALGFSTPMAAEAALVNVETSAHVELARHDRYDDHYYKGPKHYRGHGYYYDHRPPVVVHRGHPRPWSHWRPYVVERHHYYVVSEPVYYSSHPHYGPYYRVRARDRDDVLLWIGISAITGAILFSNY